MIEVNGAAVPFTGYQDSVVLPMQTNGVPGSVTIIFPFTDAYMVGEFVFHCHILAHEDGGMMQTVQVLNACQSIDEGDATWPITLTGKTAAGSCDSGYTGTPSRTCNSDGTWGSISNSCVASSNDAATTAGSRFALALVLLSSLMAI